MTALLSRTPRAQTFTEAWTRKFGEVVREAAGRDGRLTITEAKRIAERTDGGRFFSDNATAWLFANHQKSVSVNKLIDRAEDYAASSAAKAAAGDGWISYADAASKLRPDLRDDFLYLRGKIQDPPQRTPEQFRAVVKAALLRGFETGTAKRLSGPPATVRGRREVVEALTWAPKQVTLRAWVAEGRIYASVAASRDSVGRSMVGWYDLGKVPPA